MFVKEVNEQDLLRNLEFLKVPHTGIETIRSKLAMKIFDECTNVLKDMYSVRFNGRPADRDDSMKAQLVPCGPTPPVLPSSPPSQSGSLM